MMSKGVQFSPHFCKCKTVCSVYDCRAAKVDPHLRFHSFPEEINRCDAWLKALAMKKEPIPSMRVCFLHFQRGDYEENCKTNCSFIKVFQSLNFFLIIMLDYITGLPGVSVYRQLKKSAVPNTCFPPVFHDTVERSEVLDIHPVTKKPRIEDRTPRILKRSNCRRRLPLTPVENLSVSSNSAPHVASEFDSLKSVGVKQDSSVSIDP